MICIVCNQEKEKIFTNASCNAKQKNNKRIESGKHNFLNQEKIVCPICLCKIAKNNFASHSKICITPNFCLNCGKQIKTNSDNTKFCGRSCAGIYNNKKRKENGYNPKIIAKDIESKCHQCSGIIFIKNNHSKKNSGILCNSCKKIKQIKKEIINRTSICEVCGKNYKHFKGIKN